MKALSLVFALVIFSTGFLRADPPVLVYSPDKNFVVTWFTTGTDAPDGPTRNIVLSRLPHHDTLFSLSSSPRYTKAFWSPDSKRCLIVDAPDNGNTNTWLFVANGPGNKPYTIRIGPLSPPEKFFYDHWDGQHLWRPCIIDALWVNNETLEIHAADNNGEYKITLKMNAPDKPVIQKMKGTPYE